MPYLLLDETDNVAWIALCLRLGGQDSGSNECDNKNGLHILLAELLAITAQ